MIRSILLLAIFLAACSSPFEKALMQKFTKGNSIPFSISKISFFCYPTTVAKPIYQLEIDSVNKVKYATWQGGGAKKYYKSLATNFFIQRTNYLLQNVRFRKDSLAYTYAADGPIIRILVTYKNGRKVFLEGNTFPDKVKELVHLVYTTKQAIGLHESEPLILEESISKFQTAVQTIKFTPPSP